MLGSGGSAYLPRTLGDAYVGLARLWPVADAPVFARKKYFIVNDSAAQNWGWFPALLERLSTKVQAARPMIE
jgi:capsular polysaccharide biosynthesis protein